MSCADTIASITLPGSFDSMKIGVSPVESTPLQISSGGLVITQEEREKFANRLMKYRSSIKLQEPSSSSSKQLNTTLRRSIPDWIGDGTSVTDPSEMEHKHHVKKGLIVRRLTASVVIRNENKKLRKNSHPLVVKKNSKLYHFLTPKVMNCKAESGNDRKIEAKIMTRKYLNPIFLHNNFMQHTIDMDSERVNQLHGQ